MKTKKVVVGAIAATMLSLSVCSLAPVAAAGETVQISVGTTNAKVGGDFSVDVSLADIPSSGIQALDFAVAYDSSVLTITSVEAGGLVTKIPQSADLSASLSDLFESSINSKEGCVNLIWSTAAEDSSYWLKGDGTFCTIKGTVSSSAKEGTSSELAVKAIDRETYSGSKTVNGKIGCGYESNGKPVKLDVETTNGKVTIGTQPTTGGPSVTLAGDTNCDGVVELADAILIMQSLANPNKYGISGSDAKHLTNQGKVNGDVDKDVVGLTSNDALKIQNYLLHNIKEL
ncbi:cohesin domain-containing protein [uncultured Ruminococcus sp.]|uniref:cohesin domain-containing protein n=1 Tax=uncultured Ruminococcus sp. TaxID=165186 RepID=UPI002635C41C|nr:cohesin domain-containing protein [uncultured Ruminococcus sp.]